VSWRQRQKSDDYFAVPKNYKLAEDDLELYLGGSEFSELFYQIKNSKLPKKKTP
jgi:hypothetical protein